MSKAEGFPPKAVRYGLLGHPNASPVARGAPQAGARTDPKVFLSSKNAFRADPKVFFDYKNPFHADPKVFSTPQTVF